MDESALTGESAPVGKQVAAVPPTTPLAERSSMAYAGTDHPRPGPRPRDGHRAGDADGLDRGPAAAAKPPATPLQRRLAGLSRLMVGWASGSLRH